MVISILPTIEILVMEFQVGDKKLVRYLPEILKSQRGHPFNTLASFFYNFDLSLPSAVFYYYIWPIFDPFPPKIGQRLKWMVPNGIFFCKNILPSKCPTNATLAFRKSISLDLRNFFKWNQTYIYIFTK